MISDAQARALLQAAGDEVTVNPPDPLAVISATRHAARRRVLSVVGLAAAVGVVAGGGALLRPNLGGDAHQSVRVIHGSPTDPIINTWKTPSKAGLEALVGGVLEVSLDGCLIVRDGNGRITDLVWPHGFSTTTRPDGTVVVLNQAGHPIVRVGQSFTAAGGLIPHVHGLACRADHTHSDVMSIDAEISTEEVEGSPSH